jgi:hypothetical protein
MYLYRKALEIEFMIVDCGFEDLFSVERNINARKARPKFKILEIFDLSPSGSISQSV